MSDYPFDMTVLDLIEKLTRLAEKHGNIFVEAYAEGCYCGANVTYCPEVPAKMRGKFEIEPRYPEVILIGEVPY